jgi:hypothetical protein
MKSLSFFNFLGGGLVAADVDARGFGVEVEVDGRGAEDFLASGVGFFFRRDASPSSSSSSLDDMSAAGLLRLTAVLTDRIGASSSLPSITRSLFGLRGDYERTNDVICTMLPS